MADRWDDFRSLAIEEINKTNEGTGEAAIIHGLRALVFAVLHVSDQIEYK